MITLSTHVLDTAHGSPAAGMALTLSANGNILFAGETDADGRCPDIPPLSPGTYRLAFGVAAYFRAMGVSLSDPPFLDVVSLEFGIAGPSGRYHVPLLVSPYSYSTYRGS